MPQTEAQKRAKAKYDAKTYKVITSKCKLQEYDNFRNYADAQGIGSMSLLMRRAVKYCIDNNIDLNTESEVN